MIVHATKSQRAATVLVLFALFSFGIFALAALTIDLGMLRYTQRQMQSASDTHALETLRANPDAASLAMQVLADSQSMQLQLTPTPGVSDLDPAWNPSALLSVTPRSENIAATTSDIQYNPPIAQTPDSAQVSLRYRMPLLFGQGSLIQPNSAGFSVRRAGLTARSQSRARSQPVRTIGARHASLNMDGCASFAINSADWLSNNSFTVTTTIRSRSYSLGDTLEAYQSGDPIDGRFVPIIANINSVERIVGFGEVTISGNVATKVVSGLQPQNVSATIPGNASLFSLPATEIELIWQAADELQGTTIQAAALTRD